MKSAERFLTQGKLNSAISEYKSIVENDPKDINTMNMLGDLYARCKDQKAAVNCYQQVAEYYNGQGFAKKAISIYNKIYRIEPDSLEIQERLAELYKIRGSVAEARKHYEDISKRYEEIDFLEKALEIWEIIGELDPQNADIQLKIAEYYWQNDQKENAAESYIKAGSRLSENNREEAAVTAFSRALEILPENMAALNGLIETQIKSGYPEEAAKTLEGLADKDPYNKEIANLLIDCYFELNNPEKAEEVIVRIVEREPANYERLINLIDIYLEKDDLESTVRILSMVSEHLLIDGKNEKLIGYIDEVLARNPEHLEALRLQARFYGWQKDEAELQKTLERMVETSRTLEAVEDERYALSQLLMLVPHNVEFSNRFKEINELYDFDNQLTGEKLLKNDSNDVPDYQSFENLNGESEFPAGEFKLETNGYEQNGFAVEAKTDFESDSNFNYEEAELQSDEDGIKDFEFQNAEIENNFVPEDAELTLSDEKEIEDEIESIKFYLEQGYSGLAEKSLEKLEHKFGRNAISDDIREQIYGASENASDIQESPVSANVFELTEDAYVLESAGTLPEPGEMNFEQAEEFIEDKPDISEKSPAKNDFENFRDELGFEETDDSKSEDDYENHYHYAVAYQEMGLMEDAIREFQDAANCVEVNDGTRRFFQCCNLLGHCFMEKQMPQLALVWLEKALDTDDLDEEEKQGILYELANAYQANGEKDEARKIFEQIYASDVDYRDVGNRIENLKEELIAQ